MIDQKPNWANPNKLLLAWYLLQIAKEKSEKKSKFGKDFIRDCFPNLTTYEIFKLSDLEMFLRGFIRDGLISEMYEERFIHDEKKDETVSKGVEHITLDKVSDLFDFSSIVGSDIFSIEYDFKINHKKVLSFIKDYLEKWKNDKLFLPDMNFPKAEKQLEKVAKHIHYLLWNYSVEMLLVDEPYSSEKIDFIAGMLFLESIGDIEILKLDVKKKDKLFGGQEMALRVNVKDKFFQDFKDDQIRLNFDFEKLKKGEKEEILDKITFHPPKLLRFKNIEYEIKEGCIPQTLLKLAASKKSKAILSKELEDVTEGGKKVIKKALNNFRRNLRKKFSFPSNELFFEVKAGEIRFKDDLFQF
ncbi:MAG: hypothetical protein PHO48_00605 [Candidatus Gracilibacteria bacterium]|nr:hypothetical protein [Candidatus Gracilibacteria bacterium]MDD5179249.1 hypothetical protein [Candidatus Gracilibacteria bacterium]